MIKAFLFDMDGTLVQTEILKAMSYAKAAHELRPSLKEEEVVDAFKDVVGLSRREVAQKLMERFNLEKEASAKMETLKVQQPWQAFVQMRMEIYDSMISDPEIINRHLCPYNLGLLKWVRQNGYPTGLGTQSQRPETMRILEILEINKDFDFIATREDVENPKPDPEIYNLLADELKVSPNQCLVIEDSASGVKAALAAGMGCIAVTTDLTREGVHKLVSFDNFLIVDSPPELLGAVKSYIADKELSLLEIQMSETKNRERLELQDRLKQKAASYAIDFVQSGMVLGLGTGSTTRFALEDIGLRIKNGQLQDIVGIPSSQQTEKIAKDFGIPLTSFDEHQEIDLTIDGADEVDPQLNLIKGGGGALLREKILAQSSRRNIIIVDENKLSPKLGTHFALPIEVIPFAWKLEANYVSSLGANVTLRKKNGVSPYTTDQNNFILDCKFEPISDPNELALKLSQRAGIVEHGLFLGLATEVIVATENEIRHLKRKGI